MYGTAGRGRHLRRRVSSAVEQRFCKPLVGSSNLSPGTIQRRRLSWSFVAPPSPRRNISYLHQDSAARPNLLHNVLCWWPQSLHLYSTRVSPASAETRLAAPHLLHFTSSRVLPCVTVSFRASASLTRRSLSSRIS